MEGGSKARLLSRIRNQRSHHLPVRNPALPAPLSSAQRGLWFLDRLEPGRSDYVVPIALRLRGAVDVAALEEALSGLVARHEVLRTRFLADELGEPYQVIDPPDRVAVEALDLPGADHATVTARVNAVAATPFDLAAGPLLRTVLIRTGTEESVLVMCLHHIVFDGWSEAIFARELRELYAAATGGGPAELPEPRVQYADYAAWQQEQLGGERFRAQLDYWRTRLAGLQPLNLPTDRPRGPEHEGNGDAVVFTVPAATAGALRDVAAAANASLFMVLLAAFQVLLARYSGQDDVAVGIPVAGRDHADAEDLIGLFVNSLVLRTDLSGDPSFTELLERVKETALGAFDHQELPFERLVEEFAPQREISRNPLFQTMFVLQTSAETQPWELPGLTVEPAPVTGGLAKFDLNLALRETGDGLKGYFDYPADLFDRSTVERMAGHFQTLLAEFVSVPEARLSEVGMLSGVERDRVLVEWNATSGSFPVGRTIHGLVAERAVSCPGEPAVVHGDVVLTHGELEARANRLAHYLRGRGVGPGVLVGVFLERGPELVVTLLGVMKAGGAWVPLDPEYPVERLVFMLEDTAAPLVITQSSLAGRLPEGAARLLIDGEWSGSAPVGEVEPLAGSRDLAYVIYTSGSTGRPKGVMIEHEGVVNYLHWCAQNYPPDGDVGTLLYSPVAFDLTVTALFLPLLQGLPVVVPVPEPGESIFAASVEYLLTGVPVSFLKMTPSHAELLVASAEAAGVRLNVHTMVLGGEELTADLARRILEWVPGTVIYNEYGATECSVANVMSATRQVGEGATGGVSVGGPITNTTAYVVDGENRLVPVGVAGECLLGGICVARGYLNRPELTAERFVELDLGAGPQRLYRTGDLCRWLPNGELEFIGRIDTQVKLRGYRIELGEIEATLIDHPAIASAAVTVREDTPGVQRLVAYLVPAPGAEPPDEAEVKAHAARRLPAYMVPAAYVTLDGLPLTPNGKTDRDALPSPAGHQGRTHVPPTTPTEHLIAGIWRDVLGADDPGVHDNFFDLGGHSLLAIKVTTRLRRAGCPTTLQQVMRHPTIHELARALAGASREQTGLVAEVRPRRSAPAKLPDLFCIHPGGGQIHSYQKLADTMDGTFRVLGVQAAGLADDEAPLEDIRAMAERYWKEIANLQPEGPYRLLGWSAGAVILHEMTLMHPDQVRSAFLLEPAVTGPERKERFDGLAEIFERAESLWRRGQAETGEARKRTERELKRLAGPMNIDDDAVVLDEWLPYNVLRAESRALADYRASLSEARATLVVSDEINRPGQELMAVGDRTRYVAHWKGLYPRGLRVIDLPGGHYDMLENGAALAVISAALRG